MSEAVESRLPKAKVPAAETPRPEGLLGLATGVVVIAALFFAREVLIPITLAILLSFVLAPLVRLLRRIRLPRVAAVLLSVVAALAGILLLGGLIGMQVATLSGDLPQYQSTIEHKIGSVRTMTLGRMNTLMARVGPAWLPVVRVPPSPRAARLRWCPRRASTRVAADASTSRRRSRATTTRRVRSPPCGASASAIAASRSSSGCAPTACATCAT